MKIRVWIAAAFAAVFGCAQVNAQTTILPPGETCFQATSGLSGMVGTLGAVTGGSSYAPGTYGGVALSGGSGSGATANIVVSGSGVVATVAILDPGTQYVVGDVLSAAAANIGGSGAGFSVPVNSVSINSSLAGGTAAYYLPNTLTFKTTWKNAAQTVPNTNPVRLDQNGCASVYGLGSYRQIVKDSLGNTVWDALTASTAAISNIPASSGSGDFMAIGTVIPIAAFSAPVNYVLAYGQAISRTTYSDALTALTISSTASCVSTSTTVSGLASTAQMRVGAPIEGSCLTPGTTIATIAGSTSVTVSIAAVSTTSTTIRVFPWGDGDGSTTFNVPDLRGRVLPGDDSMGGTAANRLTALSMGTSAASPGVSGGAQVQTLITGNLPPYTPGGTNSVPTTTVTVTGNQQVLNNSAGATWQSGANGGNNATAIAATATTTAPTFSGTAQGGTSAAFAIVQPSLTINYAIKVLNGTLPTVGVLSIGGMTGDIVCGTGIACAAGILSLNFTPGTMASQNANNVTITGGTINGANIGATTPAPGNFSALAINGVPVGTSSSSYWSLIGGGPNINYTAGDATPRSSGTNFIYATAFGVTADGVTNDGPALLTAMAASTSMNPAFTGGTIVLPAGVINVASQNFVINYGITMIGAGQGVKSPTYDPTTNIGATIIKTSKTTGNVFEFHTKNPVNISNLWIKVTPSGSVSTVCISIDNQDPAIPANATVNFNSRISNVTCTGAGTGILTLNAGAFSFYNNYIQDYRVCGICGSNDATNPDSGDAAISGNHIQSFYTVSGIGIQLGQMGGLAVGPNNKILGGTVGIQLNASIAGQIGGETNIHDNNIEAQSSVAVLVTQAVATSQIGGVNVINNHINSGLVPGAFIGAIVFVTSGTGTNYIKRGKILGNDIVYGNSGVGASAIEIEAGEGIEINANTFAIPANNHTISINSEAVSVYYHNNIVVSGPSASGIFGTINAGNNLIIDYNGASFANIPTSSVKNGSVMYVSDGCATSSSNYLLAGGCNGMIANRIRSGWYATQPFNP